MWENFGERIRQLRVQKGVTLNSFAKELEVSTGYLSKLETGKTVTIPLKTLEKLQDELAILPINPGVWEVDQRFSSVKQQYDKLLEEKPETADFLLSNFEDSVRFFLKESKQKP